MSPEFRIRPVRTPADLRAAAGLFDRYASSLDIDLSYQGFDRELASLPGAYAPPAGELLLARSPEGLPAGCAALRPLQPEGCCEMKRLFTVPAARGRGLGRSLVEAVIAAARRRGYRELRLDTLPGMEAAIALYGRLGFQPIGPYGVAAPGAVFMALTL